MTKKKIAPKKKLSKWVQLVEQHGVMLASAAGPVLNIAESVAGEPIIGGWWAHTKGKAIYAALSELDESDDIRCFKLIDGKVTFVHRRVWPALVVLGQQKLIPREALGCIVQKHMPSGEHRNVITPFPTWADKKTLAAAKQLDREAALAFMPYFAD